MGEEDEQQHKTMIKQLTDLDDHALDEQAGLFMHPRRKSLRTETTPRPVSQPFFQPLQVFPDVLSVSAMVERQEQKGQQQQRDNPRDNSTEPSVHQQSSGTAPQGERAAVSSLSAGQNAAVHGGMSSGTTTPASGLAQYPQGLALHTPQPGDGAGVSEARAHQQATLRTVSLTRMAMERGDASGSRPGSSDAPRRDGAGSGEAQRGRRPGPLGMSHTEEVHTPHGQRGNTPVETPTEEGDRQLSVETSRPNRMGRRAGKRAAGPSSSDGRGAQTRNARLFARRANASSRGSDEENSDDDEQFIYRHSRSSMHVSSIPEEYSEERGEPGRRRPNRHRLSTFMGGERRDSAGVSGGSYTHVYGASTRPGRRQQAARAARGGGGGSVTANPAAAAGGYFHGGSSSISGAGNQHRFSILTQNEYGVSSESSDGDGEPAGLRSTYGNVYSRRNSRRQAQAYYGSSEELPETTPLFRRHNARRKRSGSVAQAARAAGVSALVLAALFVVVALFNLTSAPLREVEAVRVTNILATEKELLFILHVHATNPNIREVLVERAEIGVFAAAAVADDSSTPSTPAHVRSSGRPRSSAHTRSLASANKTAPAAILLGNVYELSDPMRFSSGSLRREATNVMTTQISIHHPGGSLDVSEEDSPNWRRLLKGPYDLTIRGTLQYTLWQRNYAARICIAKLANLPPDGNSTLPLQLSVAAGMGCDADDDDDPVTLPEPPTPPLG
ncbi:Vacuolar inheritance and morphology protein [Coemansia guatemalensis]|uniref:Vacuolar inheritance and morphology protein n=1 Tax=Coemansia guatemalensis TaxID=2761395 RepID=A0A9W8LRQ9_9FUNG|nr:Vacuolar inheritance and morphology protein [Coemansia guatemalensis]